MASGQEGAALEECLGVISAQLGRERTLDQLTEILPARLYLGNVDHACNDALLREHGIAAVVNCCAGQHTPPEHLHAATLPSLDLCAVDSPHYDLVQPHTPAVLAFLEEHAGVPVLMHCVSGVNRSAALCIAYLVAAKAWPLLEAMRHVAERRSPVLCRLEKVAQRKELRPDVAFLRQLVAFAAAPSAPLTASPPDNGEPENGAPPG
uniref:protein-tyrosine-phosphatase n=1 Tax=Alexandrium monilatum TaxID=311494 RepID=A0A7S4PVQ6_9DINO